MNIKEKNMLINKLMIKSDFPKTPLRAMKYDAPKTPLRMINHEESEMTEAHNN